MSQNNTVARPYAKAAFELAKSSGEFEAWTELLYGAKLMVEDKRFLELIKDPKFSDEQVLEWIKDILADVLFTSGTSMLDLLAENNRLTAAPEIFELYQSMRYSYQRTVQAYVSSAKPLNESHMQTIVSALRSRLGVEKVELNCKIDESLMAGALIKAGDVVIDGSARGRLTQLSEALGV